MDSKKLEQFKTIVDECDWLATIPDDRYCDYVHPELMQATFEFAAEVDIDIDAYDTDEDKDEDRTTLFEIVNENFLKHLLGKSTKVSKWVMLVEDVYDIEILRALQFDSIDAGFEWIGKKYAIPMCDIKELKNKECEGCVLIAIDDKNYRFANQEDHDMEYPRGSLGFEMHRIDTPE